MCYSTSYSRCYPIKLKEGLCRVQSLRYKHRAKKHSLAR